MDGILLVDKPKGWTSFDVVAKIRGTLKSQSPTTSPQTRAKPKVGHTGTLDPQASGLMIVVVGKYCKRAAEFSKLSKVYQVEMTLGSISTTGDIEGTITKVSDIDFTPEIIQAVLKSFTGKIEQVPPIYSAIKINGQRAYDLARAGKAPEMKSREVTIHSLKNIRIKYPKIYFDADVSSGTYIRSLVSDIGQKLGSGAYLSDLRRVKVGGYDIKDSLTIEQMISQKITPISELA